MRIQKCKFYSWSLAFCPLTIFPCSLALIPGPYALDLDYLLSKETKFDIFLVLPSSYLYKILFSYNYQVVLELIQGGKKWEFYFFV